MQRILAATDGSPDGQAALRWAVDLARAASAELLVTTAWRPEYSEVPPEQYDDLREQARQRLDDDHCGDVRDAGVPYRCVVLGGDPRAVILAAADDLDADLVVVGTRGMGRRHHALHLGSVAHHLAHHSTRPLATIPASARTSWPTTVLVGVDGSERGAHALAWAAELATSMHSDLVAAYAEAPPAEWVPHDDPKSWYQSATRDLDGWVAPYATPEHPIRTVVVDHEPGPGIADAATRERAGLIVVGARGSGPVTGVRLGSTAFKVLHQSQLPVVIVP